MGGCCDSSPEPSLSLRERMSLSMRSISGRLTLAVAIVGLAVFVVVGSLLQWALRRELERMRERDLDGRADVVAHFLDEVEAGDDLSELRHHLDDVLIGDGQLRIWLIADSGARFDLQLSLQIPPPRWEN